MSRLFLNANTAGLKIYMKLRFAINFSIRKDHLFVVYPFWLKDLETLKLFRGVLIVFFFQILHVGSSHFE